MNSGFDLDCTKVITQRRMSSVSQNNILIPPFGANMQAFLIKYVSSPTRPLECLNPYH